MELQVEVSNPKGLPQTGVMTDKAYIPLPFLKHMINPQEWIHVLATLTVSALPKSTKFCDKDGYDIIPIRMIKTRVRKEPFQEQFHKSRNELELEDIVSIRDISNSDYSTADDDEERWLNSFEGYDSNDKIVPEEELEKIRILLRGREGVDLDLPKHKPKRKFCKSHRKFRKKAEERKRKRGCGKRRLYSTSHTS